MSKKEIKKAVSGNPDNSNTSSYESYERELHIEKSDNAIYKAIIKTTRDAIVSIDDQGIIQVWNPAAEEIFGWTQAEAVGKEIHELLASTQLFASAEIGLNHFKISHTGPLISRTVELNARHKRGYEFPIELSLSALDHYGKTGAVATVRKAKISKDTELVNSEALNKYEILFQSSFDSLMTLSPTTGFFTSGNPATWKLFGAKNEAEFTTCAPWELSPEFQPDGQLSDNKAKLCIEKAIKEGTYSFEWTHRRFNGELFPAFVQLTRIDVADEAMIFATVRDLTQQTKDEAINKQLQAQLFHSQKMEAIGTLAGGIAHDFNNLLTVILANVEIMKDDVEKTSNTYHDLKEIDTAAKKAAELTKGLLAFSRKQKLNVTLIDLNVVVQEFMVSLKRIVGEDVEIIQNFDQDTWNIMADSSQIISIVANLVTNSRQAMPEGGVIKLEIKNVTFTENNLPKIEGAYVGDYVMLSVEDTGTGISPDVLPRIYEPFFTTKEIGDGTGLGLAMIQGSVLQHGGFIRVHSELGNGARFELYFPSKGIGNNVKEPISTRNIWIQGNETILIVEDDENVRKITSRILKKCGYKIIEAENAGMASLKLNSMKESDVTIDLVLTDVRMPNISGIALGKNIEKSFPNLPVIYMSGFSNDDNEALKGKSFLAKPFSSLNLSTKIRQILDLNKIK